MDFLQEHGKKVVLVVVGLVVAVSGLVFGSTAGLDKVCELHEEGEIPVVNQEAPTEEEEE